MKAISEDLRQRILDTVQRGDGSLCQIARRFLVSVSFITRLLQLHRSTGSLEPRPHGGGNPAVLSSEDLQQLRELVQRQPDATLEELRQRLGVSCSLMTISRALRKLGLPRKKKIPRSQEQDRPDVQEQRQQFCAKLAGVDPRRLVFVDESGANTAMTPDAWPCPGGTASLYQYPRPMGVDHDDLRAASLWSDGAVGLSGCDQHRHLRDLRAGGAGPGIEARRRGYLGQSQAAQVGRSDRGH